jgi:hypothetical protein
MTPPWPRKDETMSKPKKPQTKDYKNTQTRDKFQTPDYGTDFIVHYLNGVIWECAAGDGFMVRRLQHHGFDVVETELDRGFNFLADKPLFPFDMIITNPPFSLKIEFYARCRSYGKPFALLVPADLALWNLIAVRNDGAQWLIPTRRIDYITPSGKSGGDSQAQFHSGWLTWGLNLPDRLTIVDLPLEVKAGGVLLPMFANAETWTHQPGDVEIVEPV